MEDVMSIKIGEKLYRKDGQIIYLENLNLTSLPFSIGDFKNLRKIHLASNQLTFLPESICNLSMLEELYINDNKIESLPQNINKLLKLHTIDAINNNLITLPETIYLLPNLKVLGLFNNKLKNLSLKIKNIPYARFNENSYQLNNLSSDCEILIIDDLVSKLENLPPSIKEIHLYKPKKVDISKLPFGCLLYIDYKLQKIPQ